VFKYNIASLGVQDGYPKESLKSPPDIFVGIDLCVDPFSHPAVGGNTRGLT